MKGPFIHAFDEDPTSEAGMQMAIRREAAAIFLGGGYLKAWMALMEYGMSRYVPDELAFGQSYL